MMKKIALDTPCLVIDKPRLLANLQTMQQEVTEAQKNLRPHIKTHKCIELAKLQIAHGAIGVSATKLGEVEVLAKAKIPGILITSPIVTPVKIKRLMVCVKQMPDIMVVTDSQQNASDLNDAAKAQNMVLNVLIDIDSGIGRTGVDFSQAVSFAQFVNDLASLNFVGVQCYAGNLQHMSDYQERKVASQTVMKKASDVVEAMRELGIACPILTGSGTGTYDFDMEVAQVTEVQPGSYTVMDMEYQLIGSKENAQRLDRFQPAMTMLVTVISANQATHVTVDAGTKALYFDANTKPKIISHPGLHYDWSLFGDEHGRITADEGVTLPKVGEVLEIIVPHCDPTINLFDVFYLCEGDEVVDVWKIAMRGKCS
jgi:D-serine deaminase-like pyridoxal phosphate-dependent protein